MPVTAVYAALLALLFLYLSQRTIKLRQTLGVGLGDGGKPQMTRAMRAHANFAEYVPFALLLIYIMEAHSDSRAWAHALCLILVVARLCHAFGFGREPEAFKLRVAGAALTFVAILGAALRLLWLGILSMVV
jgi:uncharacterized membrane protein YecN with MAPEG domain